MLQASIKVKLIDKIKNCFFILIPVCFKIKFLANQYLRTGAHAIGTSCFLVCGMIPFKTYHTLLFSTDHANVQNGFGKRSILHKLSPLRTELFFGKGEQLTQCNVDGFGG